MIDINSIGYWEEAIRDGQNFKKDFAEADEWATFTGYYRSKFKKGILPYNLIFGIGRTIIPRIYFRNPIVIVTPTLPGYDLQAQLLQKCDNLIIRENKLKNQIKLAILHAFLYGTGVMKIGYDSEYGYSEKDEMGKVKIEYNMMVQKGMPWALVARPDLYVMPWGTTNIYNKPWEAFAIFRYTEDVKNDPKYNRNARKELRGTHNFLRKDKFKFFNSSNKADWTLLWEIHDFRDGKIKVFADGGDKWLRNEDDPTQLGGISTVGLIFNEDPEVGWGIADAVVLDPTQKELNEIRTQMMKHRRLALVKFLCDKNRLDEDELEKLFNEDVGAAVWVNGPVSDAVLPLTPHIPGDLGGMSELVRRDARELIGLSRNQLGEFEASGRRTAYEASIVQAASDIRVDERRDIVADFLTDIVKQYNRIIWTYWDTERVESILGPDGRKYWVAFTGQELRGEYAYKIDPDSEIPVTKMLRRQEALELLKLFGNDPNIPGQAELRRWVASQYEGIDVNKLFIPPEMGAGRSPEAPMNIGQARRLFPQTAIEETPKQIPPNLQLLMGGMI